MNEPIRVKATLKKKNLRKRDIKFASLESPNYAANDEFRNNSNDYNNNLIVCWREKLTSDSKYRVGGLFLSFERYRPESGCALLPETAPCCLRWRWIRQTTTSFVLLLQPTGCVISVMFQFSFF